MTPIQMIVTDLDGTLLRPDKTISPFTADILRSCRQRGMVIAFATARSERSCKRLTDTVNPDAVISNGGALVRARDTMIYRAAMSRETANELLRSFLRRTDVGLITVDTDLGFFVDKPVHANNPEWSEYLPAYPMDFSQGLDCDAYKITVEISDDTTAYEIASGFPTVDVLPFAGERWFRYADTAADKLCGVKALAAHFGVDLPHVAAFGDDYGDLEMLRACGAGVAVANAISEVKAAADCICGSNDVDGPAKWLEENVL
ncbi:MAG: HAD family hydrolase [Clostridia bacterium]|nr:HAD family hydrolase [Clostridia bacterium]